LCDFDGEIAPELDRRPLAKEEWGTKVAKPSRNPFVVGREAEGVVMKKPWSPILLTLALLSASGLGHAQNKGDEEAAALEKRGKALRYALKTTAPANAIDTGAAAILVNAPIAEVRKIVTDFRKYEEIIKPFEKSRVLSRRKGVSEVYFEVPVARGAAKIWVVAHVDGPVKDGVGEKIVARYSRGNVDDFRAVWRLRAVDDTHTIVKLELLVDPKLPLPGSAVTPELQYAADKAVTAVRDKAENKTDMATATTTAKLPGPEAAGATRAPNVAKR
jgi:ribosome-associated toxin RatA of RatAB toxin-antitoxin module